jgi:uncharacterized repeat protein (TIGR03803 family)
MRFGEAKGSAMAETIGKSGVTRALQVRPTGSTLMFVIVLFTSAMVTQPMDAQTFTVLHKFNGSHGSGPAAGLTHGPSGSFYGTTEGGGDFGNGTVFRMNKDGNVHVLYSFCPVQNCVGDGSAPFGSVIRDAAGNLYGTTFHAAVGLFGTVFKIDVKGKETVLHSFSGPPDDGADPGGTLLRDSAGNLYGTTESGGLPCSQAIYGCGTVFKVDANGKETVLYRFSGDSDGGIPGAGLIKDRSGNFYGTAYVGGASGCGVVFKLTKRGMETVLHSFNCSDGDGSGPLSGLVRDPNGNLYGTTAFGGTYGQGSIFGVTEAGKETVLYSFAGGTTDGCTPLYGSLSRDEAGNLYGTTVFCGPYNGGVIFRLDSTGKETILHNFTGGADGANPYGGTLIKARGNFYGVTFGGGRANNGIVFKLSGE